MEIFSPKKKSKVEIHIPEDIIVKILYRLPFESLIRFSCVSKRWFWLIITDQHFAKSHYRLASEQKSLTQRLLVNKMNVDYLHSDSTPGSVDYSTRNLNPPLSTITNILGSCNGLICLSSGYMSDIYIWNPSTRFLHKLPDPPFFSKIIKRGRVYFSGFGYSSANDDYKVVMAVKPFGRLMTVLFSWRAGCWKRIDDSPFKPGVRPAADYPPVVLRERIHWTFMDSGQIVKFNLADNKFGAIRPPPVNGLVHCACSSYDGSLYLTCIGAGVYIQLWVMRQYGVWSSWTKLFHYEIRTPLYYPSRHIFVTAKASLLLLTPMGIGSKSMSKMTYIECKEDGQLVVKETETSYCRAMIIYEETLLSLPDSH